MKKKLLFALSTVLFFTLAGCKDPKGPAEPKGPTATVLDLSIAENRDTLAKDLAKTATSTVGSIDNSVKAELALKDSSFYYGESYYFGENKTNKQFEAYIDVKNVNASISAGFESLNTPTSFKAFAKAGIASANVDYKVADYGDPTSSLNNTTAQVAFSNVNAGVYLVGSDAYLNLGDENLKTSAATFLTQFVDEDILKDPENLQELAMIFKNYKIPSVLDPTMLAGLTSGLEIPSLEELTTLLQGVLVDLQLPISLDFITFTTYSDNSFKLDININKAVVVDILEKVVFPMMFTPEDPEVGYTPEELQMLAEMSSSILALIPDFTLKITFATDSNCRFKTLGIDVDFDYEIADTYESSDYTEYDYTTIRADLDLSLNMTYGASLDSEFPDFSSYEVMSEEVYNVLFGSVEE